jgi:superfamily I DNA and RNA helicase
MKYFRKTVCTTKIQTKIQSIYWFLIHFAGKESGCKIIFTFFNKSLNSTTALLEQFLVIFIVKQVWYK